MLRGLIPDRAKRYHARYLAQHVTHGAVGSGTWVDKFNPPLEDYEGAGLTAEFGRVPIKAVRYLIADPAGALSYDGDPAKYRYCTQAEIDAAEALSLAPTNDVEFEFEIPANSANGQTVCEVALFLDATCSVAGFATPAQVTQAGIPVYLCNLPGPDSLYADKIFNRRCRLRT